MYEIRCPSCRLRLWLYQGMGHDVPQECPGCHVSAPVDRAAAAAARLAARIASDQRVEHAKLAALEHDGDRIWRPSTGPRARR